jgi:GDP-D-mannose dehydratase
LGWQPKVGFRELIEMMVDADLRRYAEGLSGVGHTRRG